MDVLGILLQEAYWADLELALSRPWSALGKLGKTKTAPLLSPPRFLSRSPSFVPNYREPGADIRGKS